MNTSSKLLLLFFLGLSIFSCKDDDNIQTQDYFDLPNPDSIFFKTAAGEETISLQTNLYVTPEIPAEASSWCEIEFYPIPPRLVIKTKENLNGEARFTNIVLKAEQFQHTIYVEQLGQAPAIRLQQETYRINRNDTILLVPFVTNITPEVKSQANWITYTGITQGNQADTLHLNISSTKEIRRSGDVELSFRTDIKQTLHIIQQSKDTNYIPAETNSMFSKVEVNHLESNPVVTDLDQLHDGDINTMWSAGFESLPIDLDFYFENAERIDQITYHPGFWKTFPLQKFEIYAKCKGDNEFKLYGEAYDFEGHGITRKINLPQGIINPLVVRLHLLTAKETAGKYYLTASEFEFYKQNTNLTDIFTDATCSELKEGVTFEQIMLIQDEFIRNLASHLYSGTYESEFRVQEYLPYAHPDKQKENHLTRAWGFLDNASGITASENEEVIIFVGDTHGEEVGLYNFNIDLEPRPTPERITPLCEGTNIINVPTGGLLYITYLTENPQNKKPVKVHIASGKINGYFDITKHDNTYWQNLLAKRASYRYLDVKGKLCHLIFQSEDFRTYCPTDVQRLISSCDSVIYLEHELSGLYTSNRMYPNRMLCHHTNEEGNFLAYASDYHTAFIPSAVKGILDINTLRTDPWAIAHELGHVHQNRNITWTGMTEVSNNVFSLYVQTSFGNTSRIFKNDFYQISYDHLAIPGNPYSNANEDYNYYFIQLVPLWQLHLYFSKVLDYPDFYPELYEKMRVQGELNRDSEKQLNFVKLCHETGHKDLTGFFRFFGFLTATDYQGTDGLPQGQFNITQAEIDQTLSEIQQMDLTKSLAIQYLNDENTELFRQNKSVQPGSVQINGNILTLNGWQNVAAYEVRKAGKLIQISQQSEFTLKENNSDITVYAIAADGTRTEVNF